MKKCLHCNNEIKSKNKRRKYCNQTCHKESLKRFSNCKQCDKQIKSSKKFCDSSCAATFNNLNRPTKPKKVVHCKQCGIEIIYKYEQKKYCSFNCQMFWQWENITKPKVENGKCANRPTLKKYLIEKFGESCSICKIGSIWQGVKLVLQVDHIDGNGDNNKPVNLRLLCPNCHSQTETYKGGNINKPKMTKRNIAQRKAYKIKKAAA